jgi:hypothetical protein
MRDACHCEERLQASQEFFPTFNPRLLSEAKAAARDWWAETDWSGLSPRNHHHHGVLGMAGRPLKRVPLEALNHSFSLTSSEGLDMSLLLVSRAMPWNLQHQLIVKTVRAF